MAIPVSIEEEDVTTGSAPYRFGAGMVRSIPFAERLGLVKARGDEDTAGFAGEIAGDLALFLPATRIAKAGLTLASKATKAGSFLRTAAESEAAATIAAGAGLGGLRGVEEGEGFLGPATKTGLEFAAFEGAIRIARAPLRKLGHRLAPSVIGAESRAALAARESAAVVDDAERLSKRLAEDEALLAAEQNAPAKLTARPTAIDQEAFGAAGGLDTVPNVRARTVDPAMYGAEGGLPAGGAELEQVGVGPVKLPPTPAQVTKLARNEIEGGSGNRFSMAEALEGEQPLKRGLMLEDMQKPDLNPPAVKPQDLFGYEQAVNPDAVTAFEAVVADLKAAKVATTTPSEVSKAAKNTQLMRERAKAAMRARGATEEDLAYLDKLGPEMLSRIASGTSGGVDTAVVGKALRMTEQPEASMSMAERVVNREVNALEEQAIPVARTPQGYDLDASLVRFINSGKQWFTDVMGRLGFAPSHPAAKVAHYGSALRALMLETAGNEAQLRRLAGNDKDMLTKVTQYLEGKLDPAQLTPQIEQGAAFWRKATEEVLAKAQDYGVIGEAIRDYAPRVMKGTPEQIRAAFITLRKEIQGLTEDKLVSYAKKLGIDRDLLEALAVEQPKSLGRSLIGRALSVTTPRGIQRELTHEQFAHFLDKLGLEREMDAAVLLRQWKESVGQAVHRSALIKDLMGWVDPTTGQRIIIPVSEFRLHPEWKGMYESVTGKAGLKYLSLTVDGVEHVARRDVAELISRVVPRDALPAWDAISNLSTLVKRLKMFHPMFHGNNFARNLVSLSGNPATLFKFFREFGKEILSGGGEGGKLWGAFRNGEEIVNFMGKDIHPTAYLKQAAEWGLNLKGTEELALNMTDVATKAAPTVFHKVDQVLQEKLWGHMGRNMMLVVWEEMRSRMMRSGAAEDVASRAASEVVNNMFGTLTRESMSNASSQLGAMFFFARDWTYSNFRHLKGMFGMVDPALGEAERKLVQQEFWRTATVGMTYMFAMPQVINMAVTGHPSFMNESGRKNDIAVYKEPDTGRIYYVNTLGFLKDFMTLLTNDRMEFAPDEGVKRFLTNKMNPVLKFGAESITGRNMATGQTVMVPGAAGGERLVAHAERVFDLMSPIETGRIGGKSIGALLKEQGVPIPETARRQDPFRSRLSMKEIKPTLAGMASGFFVGVGKTAEEQERGHQFRLRDLAHERNLALETGNYKRAQRLQESMSSLTQEFYKDLGAQQ